VEDCAILADVLAMHLADEGHYEIIGITDTADAALELVASARPDLVLLDLALPSEADGLRVLREAKALLPTLRVLVFRGMANLHRCMELGADGYLYKTASWSKLLLALCKVCAGEGHFEEVLSSSTSGAVKREAPDNLRDEGEAGAAAAVAGPRILLAEVGRRELVAKEAIIAIHSEGDYTRLWVEGAKPYVILKPLHAWEHQLRSARFLRLDRFLLVNTRRILGLVGEPAVGRVLLRLAGAPPLPLSRAGVRRAKQWLQRYAAAGGGGVSPLRRTLKCNNERPPDRGQRPRLHRSLVRNARDRMLGVAGLAEAGPRCVPRFREARISDTYRPPSRAER
jgi:DNA-binding NarL/FixJ family response regulator